MDGQLFLNNIVLLSRSQEQYFKCLLTEYNLRSSDLDVLMFLALYPEFRTAREICDHRLVAKSLVSSSLDLLVSRGYVARETDPNDRRRAILTLMPAANEIIEKMQALNLQYQEIICSGISPEDMASFERVLTQISHNINELTAEN